MAIIVCPKCKKKHDVDLNKIKKNAPLGKKISARCKSCSHKFPVELDKLLKHEKEKFQKDIKGPRKICVTLSKGGVGKTTTSVNLSAGLALAGYKVLLVDTDTQGQSSYMLGKNPRAGLTELLTKELAPEECIIRARKNLWLLAGGKSLAGVKRIIDKKSFGAEWTLSAAMKELDSRYDFIIIDTAPGWDQLIVNVLFYATEVLVPIALEVMPLQGLAEFMKSLGSIQKYRKEIVLKYIVPTFMDTRIKGPETIFLQLEKLYSEYMCPSIRYSESLSEAPSYGKSIFEFAPGSIAAGDYKDLVRKVTLDESALL